jgi:AcrR family transcriptional regulator
MTETTDRRSDHRASIVQAAARLLQEQGAAAVTTRGVAELAGVQAPTIYRLFGDKDGLLDAVAEHVLATYVAAKAGIVEAAEAADLDPVDDLWHGWRTQIAFGLTNPSVFRLLSDPDRAVGSPAARSGRQVLAARVRRVAATGRLRVSEQRAIDLIHAAGTGTIQTLLATPVAERDLGLSDAAFEAVLGQILVDTLDHPDAGPLSAAVALGAAAPELDMLSDSERRLLGEWLERIVAGLSPA